jgi:hypothetical protein
MLEIKILKLLNVFLKQNYQSFVPPGTFQNGLAHCFGGVLTEAKGSRKQNESRCDTNHSNVLSRKFQPALYVHRLPHKISGLQAKVVAYMFPELGGMYSSLFTGIKRMTRTMIHL